MLTTTECFSKIKTCSSSFSDYYSKKKKVLCVNLDSAVSTVVVTPLIGTEVESRRTKSRCTVVLRMYYYYMFSFLLLLL